MLIQDVPLEIIDMIMLCLDQQDILELIDFGLSEYAWLRKKDLTFLEACKNGNLTGVRYLLENKLDTNIQGALCYSIIYGHLHIVKYLTKEHADINTNERAVLHINDETDYLKCVKYMIEYGVDFNFHLFIANDAGSLEAMEGFIKTGIMLHFERDGPICYGIKNGYKHIVKYLINDGYVNVYHDDDTVLRYRLEPNCLDIVKRLIDSNITNISYILYVAIICGHIGIIEYLIELVAK
jgi:hypothetical protein